MGLYPRLRHLDLSSGNEESLKYLAVILSQGKKNDIISQKHLRAYRERIRGKENEGRKTVISIFQS